MEKVELIPKFNHSGVLPPFISENYPKDPNGISPYKANLEEFVVNFLTSDIRKNILIGFIKFRLELRKLGITEGFQWIDGSFLENIEKTQMRSPSDIDLVTFAYRPSTSTDQNEWIEFTQKNQGVFNPYNTKELFSCDAYYVDLHLSQNFIVKLTSYWFGVFSHQRETYLWKGLLELPLYDNDEIVLEKIQNGGYDAS